MTKANPDALLELAETVWLVWGTKGEYSDRSEWPVAVYLDEQSAQNAAVELKRLSRDLRAIYEQREDELAEAGDWNGKTLLTGTEEGRAFQALHGEGEWLCPGDYAFDDMEFTCSAVPFRARAQQGEKMK